MPNLKETFTIKLLGLVAFEFGLPPPRPEVPKNIKSSLTFDSLHMSCPHRLDALALVGITIFGNKCFDCLDHDNDYLR